MGHVDAIYNLRYMQESDINVDLPFPVLNSITYDPHNPAKYELRK